MAARLQFTEIFAEKCKAPRHSRRSNIQHTDVGFISTRIACTYVYCTCMELKRWLCINDFVRAVSGPCLWHLKLIEMYKYMAVGGETEWLRANENAIFFLFFKFFNNFHSPSPIPYRILAANQLVKTICFDWWFVEKMCLMDGQWVLDVPRHM